MTWLVTGGAGYIGAHVVRALSRAGKTPVVFDDLSTGNRASVPAGVPFVQGSVLDAAAVVSTLSGYGVTGVIHLAGARFGGYAAERPLYSYSDNSLGFGQLLAVLVERGIDRIIYASSAAVYGQPTTATVAEDAPCLPNTVYGRSKLIGEWLLEDVGRQARLRHTSLRMVNVIGSAVPGIADHNPYHLLTRVFDDLHSGRRPRIHGDDFPTPDGTPVRDFVPVVDVAVAFVEAARRLDELESLEAAYNLGLGRGVSVRKVMDAIARVTGIPFEPEIAPARAGDAAQVVASSVLAHRDLDWEPSFSLDGAVASSWRAYQEVGARR